MMAGMETLSDKIQGCIERHQREVAAKQQLVDTTMEELLNKRDRFTAAASRGQWTEEKIIEFVETYLRLETHPLYQKDNVVLDPVCGMQISAATATNKIDLPGRTIYFCSEVCKEAFSKKNS